MIIKSYTRGQAQEAMKEWIDNYPSLPAISDDFQQLRSDLQSFNAQIRSQIDSNAQIKRQDYYLDYNLGIMLYKYFENQRGFSLRVAADDGFWRFLSVCVVPDIVSQRWGKDNESHFWSQPSRIWLRSLWWYVYLSWQGSEEATRKVLASEHFTTDTILNLEERTGRNGTYVDVYRNIIKHYSNVSKEALKKYNQNRSQAGDDLFRVVMKLNTAKLMVMDPALYAGGPDAYAKNLFIDAGVNF